MYYLRPGDKVTIISGQFAGKTATIYHGTGALQSYVVKMDDTGHIHGYDHSDILPVEPRTVLRDEGIAQHFTDLGFPSHIDRVKCGFAATLVVECGTKHPVEFYIAAHKVENLALLECEVLRAIKERRQREDGA